jgi:hypothetical protein
MPTDKQGAQDPANPRSTIYIGKRAMPPNHIVTRGYFHYQLELFLRV